MNNEKEITLREAQMLVVSECHSVTTHKVTKGAVANLSAKQTNAFVNQRGYRET